ncbi:hypothetical protein ACWT_6193 [Actinoplanes sp. SE50]|uniref:hypothetical protein n=1 Tax=unclassified Actinoplanes TaxID=2626549 RepID=UPI00023ECF30|nr:MULTISPECIES: hypothetical protein [unclassified Actinoplanes]AEV87207.1 hypothetical protein ACPL_6325 [Actinoplanes sp. SE50/110]ATO85608.1 hypothetical protein ACWT_6193 [Actinoplanes sp. SE50]SLM03021.1 hypothetical protein ACSP50_6307 [Actinoplanes sp. SE50/110]
MVTTLCFRCGGDVAVERQWCGYCAAPVVSAAPPTPTAPPAPVPDHHHPGVRRRGPAPLIALLLLLAVGVMAIAVTRRVADDPRSVAARYFDALADGDATAALRLVAGSVDLDTSQYPLLSDTALKARAHRPRDAEVRATTDAGTQFGAPARIVQVDYRADDRAITENVLAVQENHRWRLRLPFVRLAVAGQRGRQVTVNGVGLGAAGRVTVAFPGAYEAVAAPDTLFGESRATGFVQNGGFDYVAPLQFGVPELVDGALDDIRGQVRAGLDRCAASTAAQPPGCPFGLNVPGTGVAVRWTITAYPQAEVFVDGGFLAGSGVRITGWGQVHWIAGYTDPAGRKRSANADLRFPLAGAAQATPTGIQVTLI